MCTDWVSPTPIASAPAAIGPTTGMISTSPAKAPSEQPVREPERPEDEGEHDRDRGDQERLAAHVGAELGVDQVPGVPDALPLRPGEERADQILGPVALEDPVRGAREREEDPEPDLEHGQRDRDRRVDQLRAGGDVLEPPLEAGEDLVPDPRRLLRLLAELRPGAHGLSTWVSARGTTSQRNAVIAPSTMT